MALHLNAGSPHYFNYLHSVHVYRVFKERPVTVSIVPIDSQ